MGAITPLKYSGFITCDGGVDEHHDHTLMADNRLRTASNIHIDGGKIKRRPGKSIWTTATFADTFDGVHEYIDTAGSSHLLIPSGGTVYEVTATSATARDTGLTAENLHFATIRGKAFYCGATTQRKISTTTASAVGVASPTDTPVAADGGGGSVTGNYAYKVTYAIETGGAEEYESNPGPSSNSISVTSKQVTLTLPVSADARVNARYIYRTSNAGSKWYYLAKVSNNTDVSYTDTGAVTDAGLGDEVESTHAVPTQGTIIEGCNERAFWLDGAFLRWSENGITDAYIEYQPSANYRRLPNNGKGIGLKRLYNTNTGREDLYIFQTDTIAVLPQGDPGQNILTISRAVGLKAHDTIVEYNGALVFLSNKQTVSMITGGRVVDLSTRNIPTSAAGFLSASTAKAALIFDHYYAICTRNDAGKLYNHRVWLCDLRTLREIQAGQCDACWFPWELDAEYLIQTSDGTVLMLDSNGRKIYKLSVVNIQDQNSAGTLVDFESSFRTKSFYGDSVFALKHPIKIGVRGRFEHDLTITPYYYSDRAGASATTVSGRNLFIMGASKMGDNMSQLPTTTEAVIPSEVVGNTFSFKFSTSQADNFFEFIGFQFTYQAFAREI